MDIPKNCRECPHTNNCPAPHYGGAGCKHEDAIKEKTIAETILGAKTKKEDAHV